MKRVVAYIGKVLLAGLLLVLLLVALCYLPPVQRYLKDQAIDYLAEEHQLHLELQEFRLAFPLKLSLKQLYCGNTPQDTLIALKSLQIQLGLNKLFQQEWGIEKLNIQGGR